MSENAQRVPVIVGVGEIADRCREPAQGLEPLALMASALRNAESDAGVPLLHALDSLDVVAEFSWPYDKVTALLGERIGAQPSRAVYGETGGESPVRFIHEAALRIARGETRIAAIVGAESTYTVASAKKAGVALDWAPRAKGVKLSAEDYVRPLAVRHGVAIPTNVYPFYDIAAQAAWGQTQREALAESGALWSRFSEAAAANANAWLRKPLSAEQVTTPGDRNRLIAWPYTLSMVANPMVNQGAAVLLCSLALARELGVPDSKLIHIHGGAAANEPRDYLDRDQFARSHAQDVVMERAVEIAGGDAQAFDVIELYSCFPCVPKMARRSLGLGADAAMSVSGGLSFFGAPLNNYMTHACAGLVRALRERGHANALLYGQGEYVTKHHALVLSTQPAAAPLSADYRLESAADARRGPVPPLIEDYAGSASLETFTIVYGRDGQAKFGTVIARTPDGARLLARVPAEDEATLAALTDLDSIPVGTPGQVRRLDDGLLGWTRQQ